MMMMTTRNFTRKKNVSKNFSNWKKSILWKRNSDIHVKFVIVISNHSCILDT